MRKKKLLHTAILEGLTVGGIDFIIVVLLRSCKRVSRSKAAH